MKKEEIPIGTIRILKNISPVIKTKTGWKKTKYETANIKQVAKLFKAHGKFQEIIDGKFLKGQLSPEGKIQGKRIDILPNGKKLDKAFSLFAKNLTIHDESTPHWDVIYENPNGKFAYLYSLDKKQKSTKNKYQKVKDFEKILPKLERNLNNAIKKKELLALAIYTILKTKMRVGNEMYYKANGHKGLTTLKKKDLKISGNKIKFTFIAKDGVPQKIEEIFPEHYTKFLKEILSKRKSSEFIFAKNNKPLKDTEFEKAFEKYCGKKFYPHIIRSAYATSEVEKFLKQNKSANKKEVKELYEKIAEKLGHKKFSKKKSDWEISYTVTIHNYIDPKLIAKVDKITH